MKSIILITFLFFQNVSALTVHKDVANIKEVREVINQATASDFFSHETLIVFDIDNTVLAMNKSLGSDQWFNWKAGELKAQNKGISNLLHWQKTLFDLSQMRLTEWDLPFVIDELQSQYKVIALTSRSPKSRVATQRELSRHLVDFQRSSIGEAFRGSFIPLGQERKASYENGIMMTSGMHKGEMLIYLIEEIYNGDFPFSQVIFIDDHSKNTKRGFDSLSKIGIEVASLRYAKEDAIVNKFKNSFEEKLQCDLELFDLREKIVEIFGYAPQMI